MIGKRLGRMEANNVGQQQPIHRNQFPIGLRPQQAECALEELISVANRKTNYHLTFTRSLSTLLGPSQLALTSRAHTSSTPFLLDPVPPGLPPYRRLSAVEQAERRTNGLCFNCDEQFTLGHSCKTPQLLLLEANAVKNAELENESEDASPIVEISLKALTGLSPQNTMRLKGSIKKYGVTILVDSGSTHNFLNQTLAGCKVTSTDQFRVTVGDG
ncbi:hypothetical protein JRO89_XS05G0175800 [Xanthoceras sorbifolium]|uniref:Gag-pol polyprotein n=1 Tax=Xanthoceras sorbifolium TaxID=99658 RepID=A0ABQ8I2A3_9ROSI|nr:hypothetical protein JRO89_XS05G0175800 [Xanthoceras sorbifolium]